MEPGGPRARPQGRARAASGRTRAATRATGRWLPLDDGSFAVGAERDPRRVRFEGETYGGLTAVVRVNGGRWFRSFEEDARGA